MLVNKRSDARFRLLEEICRHGKRIGRIAILNPNSSNCHSEMDYIIITPAGTLTAAMV